MKFLAIKGAIMLFFYKKSKNSDILFENKNNMPIENIHQGLTKETKTLPKETLCLRGIEAVFFDMDGTMVNNIPYHKKAWDEFTKQYGISLTDKEFKLKTSGKTNNQILPSILRRELSDEEKRELADEKEALYRRLYAPHIEAVKGLYDLIRCLKAKHIKVAVATTAIEKNRQFILEALGLNDVFDAIIDQEHFTHEKPDPEIFLTGAKRLGVKPEQCIVFDDAPLGIEAARRAGMKAVGLLTLHTKDEFKDANFTIDDYSQLILEN